MSEMSDYMKIEEFKRMLMTKLYHMGMKNYLEAASPEDTHNIMVLAHNMLTKLREKEDHDEKVEFLVSYIIGLWARLIIEFQDDPRIL